MNATACFEAQLHALPEIVLVKQCRRGFEEHKSKTHMTGMPRTVRAAALPLVQKKEEEEEDGKRKEEEERKEEERKEEEKRKQEEKEKQ